MTSVRFENTYCPAKWLQVTLKLQNGTTQSCHHPPAHKVPIAELKENHEALHNTHFKKQQRELMLKSKRPTECGYCWKMEDLSLESDRFRKAREDWAQTGESRIDLQDGTKNIKPTYLEVSFSNQCNLACGYCNFESSSRIFDEFKQYGPYLYEDSLETAERKGHLPNQTENYEPFFWRWLNEVLPGLMHLRMTGGEPLIQKQLDLLLKKIEQDGHGQLSFSVNSNLMVSESHFQSFLKKIESLKKEGKIKDFTLFGSVDTGKEGAEFIRHGLDYDRFWRNLDSYLAQDIGSFVLMGTFGIYALEHFSELLDELDQRPDPRLQFHLTRLRFPRYLSLEVFDQEDAKKLEELYRRASQGGTQSQLAATTLKTYLKAVESQLERGGPRSIDLMNLSLFLKKYCERKKRTLNPTGHLSLKCQRYSKEKTPLLFLKTQGANQAVRTIKYLLPGYSQRLTF